MSDLQKETSTAIDLCVRGDMAAGVRAYRAALRATGGNALPVGMHTAFLDAAGKRDAAEAIRREGLRAGADISLYPSARHPDFHAAIAAYEAFFAAGIANAKMVSNYMVCLSRVGDAKRLAEVAAPELLLRQAVVPCDEPRELFLARISAALRAAESREFELQTRSVKAMDRVRKTHLLADPDLVALHRIVHGLADDYRRAVTASAHLMASWLPTEVSLFSWGVISDGVGYNLPHIHEGCWFVAVVYVEAGNSALSGPDESGHLRIGPPASGNHACSGWPRFSIPPVPGTVVLMPAFYTHWTVPMRGAGRRISLAFNVASPSVDENDLA